MRRLYWFLPLVLASFFASTNLWAEVSIERGRALYLTSGGYGCAVCHGPVAEGAGQAGGDIRGADIDALLTSLQTVAPMQPLAAVLSPVDLASLGLYLQGLRHVGLLELQYADGAWQGVVSITPEQNEVDLVLYNASFSEQVLDLSLLQLEQVSLAALERKAFRIPADSLVNKLQSLSVELTRKVK